MTILEGGGLSITYASIDCLSEKGNLDQKEKEDITFSVADHNSRKSYGQKI